MEKTNGQELGGFTGKKKPHHFLITRALEVTVMSTVYWECQLLAFCAS